MNVLFVAGSFHPEIGGPPRYLDALARELVAGGDTVTVVCMSPPGAPSEGYPFDVVRISRRWPVPLRLLWMLVAILRHGRRADLLFISDYGLPPIIANWVLRRPTLIKIVGDFAWEYARRHGLSEQDFDSFQTTPQRGRVRLVQRLQRFYVSRCDRVLVPSFYLQGVVMGWGIPEDRTTVIHNAIAESRFHSTVSPADARARLGLPDRYIVVVARLAPWKGVDSLIACLPQLPEGVALVVVGEGPERAALEQQAHALGVAPLVRFVGAVPFEEVSTYLRGAECLALYTGYEGLSHVLLEALAAGTPIVASAKGGNVEVVEDGVSGLLVPYGDEAALGAALRRILGDRALREQLAAGATRASARFRWNELVERTRALIIATGSSE